MPALVNWFGEGFRREKSPVYRRIWRECVISATSTDDSESEIMASRGVDLSGRIPPLSVPTDYAIMVNNSGNDPPHARNGSEDTDGDSTSRLH